MQNKWSNALQRSAEQIKESIVDKMPEFVPEITDFSDTNPFMRFIDIWANLFEILHYYQDRNSEESYPTTARRFASFAKLANMFDYRIKLAKPATSTIRFYFDNNVTQNVVIPEGTEVATKTGIAFFTLSEVTILSGQNSVNVEAKQRVLNQNKIIGVSTAQANQKFVLNKNVIEEEFSLQINGEFYESVDTFGISSPTNNHFKLTKNENNEVIVEFGDGINGRIPPAFSIITNYYTTEGSKGNLPSGSITEIKSSITVPSGFVLKCTNDSPSSNGSDSESITELRSRIPLHTSTLRRAVTQQDYIDITQTIQEVEKSGVVYNGAKRISIYVVPKGGGLASQQLLDEIVAFFANKKMLTTEVLAYPAGQIVLELEMNVRLLSSYSRAQKSEEIKKLIASFFKTENQEIAGQGYLSDITEIVEAVRGVQSSDIIKLVANPYPIPFAPNNKTMLWTKEVQTASNATVKWRVIVFSSTQYQLFRNLAFVGTFNFGAEVVQPEIIFTINTNNYTIGDRWDFVTYKYTANILLEEPSILTLDASNIVLNMSGGVS